MAPTSAVSVPMQLGDRILRSRSAIEGELKLITVLFADIAGSTELIQDLDPEQSDSRLSTPMKVMADAVHRYEGIVNKSQGDGIMAVFGAPLAHEDHAVRACYAALEMQEEISDIAKGDINIRVGLHSGQVLVRYINNDMSLQYEAIGPTVHLASRMEQLAEPGKVCITESTCRLADGFITTRALGAISVKGVRAPVETYQLKGRSEAQSRWAVRVAEGLTQFVGREEELGIIDKVLARVKKREGQVLAVVGDPGVGKSRLVHEYVRSNLPRGWSVFETWASPHSVNAPYQPISKLLRSWFGVKQSDSQQKIAERVREKLTAVDAELLPWASALHNLLDIPVEDSEWQQLSPQERRQQIIDLIKTIVIRRATAGPVLLIVEDLHWIDAETQAVLDNLFDSMGRASLFVIVTYRPEYRHRWMGKSYYREVRVDRLDDPNSKELLQRKLGDFSGLQGLIRIIVARAEGTPLFLEESVKALIETGSLLSDSGRYTLARPIDEIEIPNSIQAVLAARIDRLPAEQKELAQVASVIGRDVPLSLLEPIANLAEGDVYRLCNDLQAAEILYQTRLPPDTEFSFKHALTHDIAYASLLVGRRRELHAMVAKSTENQYATRLDEHVEDLARHALGGEVWDKAGVYCLQAGTKALGRSAFNDAIFYLEHAIAALKNLSGDRENIEMSIDARMKLRDALTATGDFKRIMQCLEQAEELARSINDYTRLAAIHIALSIIYTFSGDLRRAIKSGREARQCAEMVTERSLLIGTGYALSQAYWFHGNFRRAYDTLNQDLHFFTGDLRRQKFGLGTGSVIHYSTIGVVQANRGALVEALDRSREALEIAREVKRPFDVAFASHAVGFAHLQRGEIDESIAVLEDGVEQCRTNGINLLFPWVGCELGFTYGIAGQVKKGRSVLTEALEQAISMRLIYIEALCKVCLGHVCLLTGDNEEAIQFGETALQSVENYNFNGIKVLTLRHLGLSWIEGKSPNYGAAWDAIHQAQKLAKSLEMRPEFAHCHVALGQLHQRAGRTKDADAEFLAAEELYESMGMLTWTDRYEARRSS